MARKRKAKGPKFVRFFGSVLEALQDLGGSGRPSEVTDWIAIKFDIPEEEQNETLSSGQSRFKNQVYWARHYLVKAGYIDSSKHGVWNLTNKGLSASLDEKQALAIFQEIQATYKKDQQDNKSDTDETSPDESSTIEQTDYRSQLMKILRDLPPDGFERMCQWLLRDAGFEQVKVTGKTGDGGIDGHGLLQVNHFVSFKVLFQCKRYKGSVTVSQVRDFRGAMMGRADKGIIMTTGTFTKDARTEAIRDGVPPIELVDSESLLKMFEKLEFGLNPKTTYEVDEGFFNQFRNKPSES